MKCENYLVLCHVFNKGWHLLISKAELLCMHGSLLFVMYSVCNKHSVILSFSLHVRAKGLHFIDLNSQNK